jgi:hypothetical protein
MRRKVALVVGAFVLIGIIAPLSWAADEILLTELFGNGVHAFNRGDFREAHADLSAAIQEGSADPRAYYFRGLTYLRLGREQEAVADFQKGAEFETGESAGVYSVSRSLERIQGPARQLLERYRSTARLSARKREETQRQTQYQKRITAENDVLRKAPAVNLQPAPTDAAPPAAAAGGDNPFETPMPTPAERGGPAKPAEDANPFDPMPPPAGDNPFDPPATKPIPDSPVGKPAPVDSNPFGGDSTPMPMPPAGDKPAPGDDPFGSPSPATPSDPPSSSTPIPMPPAASPPADAPAATDGAQVKPTPNGIGGVFKSLLNGVSGTVLGGSAEGESGGLLSGLQNMIPPGPGGFGGPPPGAVPPGEVPPGAMPPAAAPAPTAPPAGDDPFGATPATPPAPATPAPTAPMPPSDDPFGTPPASAPSKPAPMPMPPASDDPFGPPSTPPKEAPQPMPTTPPSDDPFAPSPAPSEKPATPPPPTDDPFGN